MMTGMNGRTTPGCSSGITRSRIRERSASRTSGSPSPTWGEETGGARVGHLWGWRRVGLDSAWLDGSTVHLADFQLGRDNCGR